MKQIKFSLLVLFAIFIATAKSQFFDSDLWSKYRVALIQILQNQFPHLSDGLNMGKSTFHVVSTPEDAEWHRDRFDLNEVFAKYPIKLSSTFSYIGTAPDQTVPKIYERMLMKTKNPQAFQQFRNAHTESFPNHGVAKSYPWHETKTTLASFVASASGRPDGAVRFIVESSKGQTSINSPWEHTTGPITQAGSFVKEFKNGNDDDDLLDMVMDEDTDMLFGRRRRGSPPPPPPVQTIIEKSERFKVDFQAKGLEGITIAPGAWFDRHFISSNAGNLGEYFGAHGQLPVIPKIVWVAQNPHVVIELSESEWHKFQYVWNNPTTIGLSVGGAFFRTSHFKQKLMDDDDVSESVKAFYSDEANADFHADVASFTVYDDDTKATAQAAPQKEYEEDILAMNDDVNVDEEADMIFGRRRRRGSPPPPPPPPPIIIHEKVYRAEFRSTDPKPQIVAVTGEILP